jgi:molecular chaperone GrpE
MTENRKIRIRAEDDEARFSPEAGPETGQEPKADRPDAAADGVELTTGEPALPAAGDLQARLESKEKELGETYDRLLRVTAEFDNYKKRMAREMEEFRKYANQSLLKEMLSVVDHIELAIQAAGSSEAADPSLMDGLNLTLKELLRVLEKFSVKPVEAVGQPFNPEFHEAILREPCPEMPENTVIREMQKGYMIHSRLLRPSLVVVACPG